MPLTSKQLAFATGLINGLLQFDAYNASYDTSGMQEATIREAASRLAHHHEIATMVESARSKATAIVVKKHAWNLDRMVSQAEKHMDIALQDHPRRGPSVSAANGALEIIGRVTGLLADKPVEQPATITRITVVLNRGAGPGSQERVIEANYELVADPGDGEQALGP